jgi:DNA-binding SARP family transcriptional activator
MMMFRLLGPLEVHSSDGELLRISQHKLRALLSLLLLSSGRWVSTDLIHAALWADGSPRTAFGSIKTYVYQLRRILADGRTPVEPENLHKRIESRSGAYRVIADRQEIDLFLFEQAARRGREALYRGNPGPAVEHFQTALQLWRGEPFDELPAAITRAESARLTEHHWAVREDLIDARISLGQHNVVLPMLRALTIEYPMRERLWCQLLVALCHSRRRAEALSAYQAAYRFFVDELGIEPGVELQRLHQQMLTGDLANGPVPSAPAVNSADLLPMNR